MLHRAHSMIVLASMVLTTTGGARAGMIAYWNFDETGGSTALASVGSINGTLANGASFAPSSGIVGGAVLLNSANNDYVTRGNNFGFTSGSFSVQAWVKTNPGDTAAMIPVAKHLSGSGNGYGLVVNDAGDGGLGATATNKAHFYDSGTTSGVSTLVVNDGQWHQLVGVYDTTNNLALIYVDGVFQNSLARSTIVANSADFLVGGIYSGSNPLGFYRGLIDEVKLYDQALSASEVAALYDSTLAASAVPEPASIVLAGLGLFSFMARRRWRGAGA